jgi:ABC-type glutathione transport system ATPase component
VANFFSLLGPSGFGKTTLATAGKSFRSTSLFHEAITLARLRGDGDQSADGRAAAPNGLSATAQPRRSKRRRHNRVPQRAYFCRS